METLHLSVSLRIVWVCVRATHTTDLLQLGEQLILKFPAHVIMDSYRKAEAECKMIEDFFRHCFC